MKTHAQVLFSRLLALFATAHQKRNFQALLRLFLEADGRPLPQRSLSRSPSALSRFLNHARWPTWKLSLAIQQATEETLARFAAARRGRKPRLLLILDLTSLEKAGNFPELGRWLQVFHGTHGVHLVMLLLVYGPLRLPFGFTLWRGKGSPSPAKLGLRLLEQVPAWLYAYRPLVLADAAFASAAFLKGVKAMGLDAVVGMRKDRAWLPWGKLEHLEPQSAPGACPLASGPAPPGVGDELLPAPPGRESGEALCGQHRADETPCLSPLGEAPMADRSLLQGHEAAVWVGRFGRKSPVGVYRFLLSQLMEPLPSTGEAPDWGRRAEMAAVFLLLPLLHLELLIEREKLRRMARELGVWPEAMELDLEYA